MELVTLADAKTYLRVDHTDEDALIGTLLTSAMNLCVDVARISEEQWADIISDKEYSKYYSRTEMNHIRSLMRIAVLYALAYLYEHREEADHKALTLTLRSILFSVREAANL